ncbi:MAG: universal stress protein [Deltaproteobacteria bacterium]|nr:universal stress protein [Deltaproteobacteria bacterium]
MKLFREILFPVDFSEVTPKIVPWVSTIAEQFGAKIHLLFVVRKLEHFSEIDVAPVVIQDFEAAVIRGAEKNMEEFANTHLKEKLAYKTEVVLGDAAEEIINYIKAEGIDLVIMGTHGRKGLNRILFGSVADRVIKISPVPVLSINPYRVVELEK